MRKKLAQDRSTERSWGLLRLRLHRTDQRKSGVTVRFRGNGGSRRWSPAMAVRCLSRSLVLHPSATLWNQLTAASFPSVVPALLLFGGAWRQQQNQRAAGTGRVLSLGTHSSLPLRIHQAHHWHQDAAYRARDDLANAWQQSLRSCLLVAGRPRAPCILSCFRTSRTTLNVDLALPKLGTRRRPSSYSILECAWPTHACRAAQAPVHRRPAPQMRHVVARAVPLGAA